ncbi:cardiolipin synthase [Sphingobacterium sp. CZ-UAM]|uniref:cardiolipin synthase n=1 Tax=Sphingobacterium sp. CZ-UAM TaxID=1933868 RepID=UPI000984B32E|nr:cardiolipin synthase [Sphingobacterium sp. CZ-UAM]OOG20374.1 cardiolipin synthase [Sphingobacterium sp. CZ-UAM]
MKANGLLIYEIIYIIITVLTSLKVILDTRSSTKTLAYLMLIVFVPIIGILVYFSFGINYRKKKLYSKKILQDDRLETQVREHIKKYSAAIYEQGGIELADKERMYSYLLNEGNSALTGNNNVQLLFNGEEKFPLVLERLRKAQTHIHIEYYIYEDDLIGNEIADILIEKVLQGVEVRFIYDDFGSLAIHKKLVKKLIQGGVKAFPFYRIKILAFANRLNYRNHRKIIVIDGIIGFVGGINVSDKYINSEKIHNKLYWRDTHLMIEGPGVYYLQYLFLADWNFCAKANLQPTDLFFPRLLFRREYGNKIVQMASSGPDSENPTIQYTILQAIALTKNELIITSPYFIPGESILEGLTIAAYSGVKIKLLVPGVSDSFFVNAAAHSYYEELLKAGVEIYKYQKGFVHAKTLVVDRSLAIIGTANMDHRSFELNFEVNALVYDPQIANDLASAFERDILDAKKMDYYIWLNRPFYKKLIEKICRLLSPLL